MDARDRQNLMVAIVAVLLVFGSYWLLSRLHRQGQIEDCLMQRRKNCEQYVR